MYITVLVSGSGTNLQNIMDAIAQGKLSNTQIIQVLGDRDCHALERAENQTIPAMIVPRGEDFSEKLDAEIPPSTDYIILAGFLSILSPSFCEKWKGKILNIHPSLLPKYGGKGMYGNRVHQAVLQNGETQTGATLHYVTAEVDGGKILVQNAIEIPENTSVQSLQKQVLALEYQTMIEGLQWLESQ